MSERIVPGPDFAIRLRHEVGRILADPAFLRAPVQSRLLAYLCERTVARGGPVTPRAVAVEGFGRADRPGGCYPRVQVSRLRRNLALHYARRAPGEGPAVRIGHRDYRLRLGPVAGAGGERGAAGCAVLAAAALAAALAAAGLWLAFAG